MPRKSLGLGSRYRCPTCDQIVPQSGRLMYGPFAAHGTCEVKCGICGKTIDKPKLGQRHQTGAWLYKPAHNACKQQEMKAALEGAVTHGEEEN